ncbi:MAG: GAF domain-containing protein [Rhizomicrobium sp.]
MTREAIFDGDNDPRWKLLDAARDRLAMAATQEDIIAVVRSAARGVVSADGVTFVLRDNGKCHYVEEDAVGPLWKGQRFPMTACISGWCMLNGRTAAIPDIYADPRIPHDAYRPTFVKSLVMAPVGFDSPVAAIGAYWRDKRAFTPREVGAVETLAAAVSAAMARAQAA